MSNRLGHMAVVRSQFINTHIPEQAERLVSVVAYEPLEDVPGPEGSRPLRLLPVPEFIHVIAEVPDGPPAHMVWRRVGYKFRKAVGPERIEAEWHRTKSHLELILPPPDQEEEKKPATVSEKPPEPHPREKLLPFEPEKILRDYYVAEDESGRRFWLFRQGAYGFETPPRWYLHGFFA
jgi:protein ImuB